jgi:hypothetical protein
MADFNPQELARRDTDRAGRYRQHLDFYNGEQWEGRSRSRQPVFNYAKVSIDKTTSYLMQGLESACYSAEDSDQAREQAQRAEDLLRQVYEQNNLQQLDWETEIDCAVLGDACYKVTWDADEGRVRVTSPGAGGIYAWWLGDDPSKVWRVASRYQLTGEEVEMLYGVTPGKKTCWVTERWERALFEVYIEGDVVISGANPYGFIPFVIFPNLRAPKQFWGTSDIPSLMPPQRELNRALSQLSRILEFSGNPITVFENTDPEDAGQRDIQMQPGRSLYLGEGAKAYLLDLLAGGGVRLHVDYIDTIYRALHDISETPRAAFGGIEKELSGTALQIEMSSLIQKVARKRTIRTNAYHQRTDMVLALLTKYLGETFDRITHQVLWGPIMPADTERQAQTEQVLVQAGVHSRRTAMDRLGIRNPVREFDRWCEERERILTMNRELRAAPGRGGARERGVAADVEGLE